MSTQVFQTAKTLSEGFEKKSSTAFRVMYEGISKEEFAGMEAQRIHRAIQAADKGRYASPAKIHDFLRA